ncbi:glycoside hydrolase family 99-like domain-containing protein [Pseudomonas asiatica]|uniref:glycoside hydrolase family 99-like domain-containing protein n=1 Tax=Pseudomonas asiatica TaxID=2219225 RepID=UPI0023671C03|nr:glycoside hydrolase family 99-like domain-containing protein [Pseudomonas asiatica]MDD1984024.1 glycoside hydrolase family 99-like domain-containing protein [Pseudomonas asiatica]WDM90751.1 glycoside hydrolase family 99-like domain-containing protein [Pseudomonas asiatica]
MTIETKTLLQQGNQAFRERRYDDALLHYTNALIENPDLQTLIKINIDLTRSKQAQLGATAKDGTRITRNIAEHPEHQPDYFTIKSLPATADLVICAWVDSLNDYLNASKIAVKLRVPFEFIVLAKRELAESLIATALPANCGAQHFIYYPNKTTRTGAFVRVLNTGIFNKYSDLLWINKGNKIDLDPAIIEKFASNDLGDVGVLAETLIESGQVKSEFKDRHLGSWLARIHRVNKNTKISVPQGSFCVKTLVLNQVLAMNLKPAKFDSMSESAEHSAFQTLAAAIGITAHEGLFTAADSKWQPTMPTVTSRNGVKRTVKSIAFYLPQFHPIPENDAWWGKGFTEWTNVVRAKPLFRSHYQPKLPADLGFYDLRAQSVQEAQADLATQYGIHGFCYYYYWFNGQKLLNQPIENMLRSGKPDFPFCVCWANENWSRNWDGQNKHVLMEQHYSAESNLALIHEFIKMMKDPRYIRHNGKPVLLVYRIKIIPNWLETSKIWREECRKAGVGEIHLCSIRFGLEPLEGMPEQHGLDSYVLFPPQDMRFVDAKSKVHDLNPNFGGTMYSYDEVVDADIARFKPGYEWPVHRGAMLGWDNTARRLTSSRVFVGCTPMRYRSWVKQILEQEDKYNPNHESLLFINAWNEWAEGTTLEPDQQYGRAYLEATKSALKKYNVNFNTEAQIATTEQGIIKQKTFIKKYSPLSPQQSWPGKIALQPNQPTILLCAHISGHQLFGGERSFIDMLKTLRKMNFNVIATVPSSNNKDYISLISELTHAVYAFPYPQWIANREADNRLTIQFANLIAKYNVSIVYSNTIVLLEPAEAARRMGRISLTHIRELITFDDSLRERIGLPVQEIVKTVFQRYDFSIANSAATELVFARKGRTFYAPNAVDHEELSSPNEVGRIIRFGIVSSNIPKKGIADFIEVARLCADLETKAEFVVIGPENQFTKEWKKQIANGTLPNTINFAGYRDTPKQAMSEINVLLNLSQFAESFGRTVAEAMAAKRPVIAYEWGALPELVIHGKNGYLAPFGDTAAVAAYVRKVVAEPQLIPKLGAAGFKHVTTHFSHEALLSKMSTAFHGIKKSSEWKKLSSLGLTKGRINNVTVIIPVYNAVNEVKNCIESVLLHTPADVSVVVINDGSTDPNISPMLDSFKETRIKFVDNEQNIGYTRTVNLGIKLAAESDVILLNSDTIVTPNWVQAMRASAYAEPCIGTVTAMSDNAGAFSFPKQGIHNPKPEHFTHEEYAKYLIDQTFNCSLVEVPTGSGFCFYIRRALLNEIGDFDHELFPRGYGEENDFCMRANVSGWKNVITPWAFIYHVRTASFKGEKDKLVKAGVDIVIKKFPNYSQSVKSAFSSEPMQRLRAQSDITA